MANYRTDRDRFLNPDYTASILRVMLGIAPGPRTAQEITEFNEEKRQCVEYFKGGVDAAVNLTLLGINATYVVSYYRVVIRAGGQPGGIAQIMKYTLQFSKASQQGASFIETIARNTNRVGDALAKCKSGAAKFLAFLVCLQLLVHYKRGDYPKMVAEIAKTALCGAFPVIAFMDLIDAILGLFVPEWVLKQPTVRVLRTMNPAAVAFNAVDNMCWVCYISTMAIQRNWTAVSKAFESWANKMEQSPMNIYTCLSRDTAMLFDEYILPNSWSTFTVYGASIRNLADYARAHPTDY